MSLADPVPEALLRDHHVDVDVEPPSRQRLRLLQARWRKEQGLPIGHHRSPHGEERQLGSRLAMPAAKEQLLNYLAETIRGVVADKLDRTDAASSGKMYATPRIYDDLLSSQPLCSNLFGELKAEADHEIATAVARRLWPDRVEQVTRIEFEHSPGRDDLVYTGNRTAFDVYLEHTCPGGGHGFVGIEVKYHEDLRGSAAENHARAEEVAQRSGISPKPVGDSSDPAPPRRGTGSAALHPGNGSGLCGDLLAGRARQESLTTVARAME